MKALTAFDLSIPDSAVRVSERRIAGLAAGFSLVLSLLAAVTDDVLNSDGMWYVYTAQVFVEEGSSAALAKFDWPFLPVLIGLLHVGTGLSYVASSYLLNAVLLAALSTGFVLLYREIGGPRVWVAAAVILLSPFLNEYRNYVIRDFGFWCFGVWAILFFVRYCRRHRSWQDALGWQLCVLAAVAFRIEGVSLAVLLPLYCCFLPRQRFSAWLRANIVFLAGILGAIALVMLDIVPLTYLRRFEYLQSFLSWSVLSGDFTGKMVVVSHHLQGIPSISDTPAFLIGGALGIFVRQTVGGLGLLGLPLAAGLWQRRLRLAEWSVLSWAMFAAAVPVVMFALRDLFLSGRYPGLLVLLLSLPAARMLDEYLPRLDWMWKKYPLRLGVIVVALSVWTVDSVMVTRHYKLFLREAGEWAEAHVPPAARLYANDDTLYFYYGRGYTREAQYADNPVLAAKPVTDAYDWLLLHVHRQDAESFQTKLAARPELRLETRFENPKGDAVYALHVEPAAAGN
ncbi:MAG TPA: hypothetical protein VI457_02725 [Methylococcaceae bacterium]|nr:hypothetical protein [Methylococcaceae bacterium]